MAVTPNGYADALSEDKRLFVMPHEETMSVDHFLGTYTVTQDLIYPNGYLILILSPKSSIKIVLVTSLKIHQSFRIGNYPIVIPGTDFCLVSVKRWKVEQSS